MCTCKYEDDRATVERDADGKARCEYYDGKVLSGKYVELKERGNDKRESAAKYQEYKIRDMYVKKP